MSIVLDPCDTELTTYTHRRVGWAFLEQLALASIDVGRLDIAEVRSSTEAVGESRWRLTEKLAMLATTL